MLSPREREVLRLIAKGFTTYAVAAELRISIHTAGSHLRKAFLKLNVHSRAEASAVFVTTGDCP